MDIQKVFVMGSGAMGSGIAQVCAQRGISVVMCDLTRGCARQGGQNNQLVRL